MAFFFNLFPDSFGWVVTISVVMIEIAGLRETVGDVVWIGLGAFAIYFLFQAGLMMRQKRIKAEHEAKEAHHRAERQRHMNSYAKEKLGDG